MDVTLFESIAQLGGTVATTALFIWYLYQRNGKQDDDVKNLSQIWAVAPALVKLALRDDRRSQINKEPPWKRIAEGLSSAT